MDSQGLWKLQTGPSKGLGLTAPRRNALKLILQCEEGQNFLTTRPEREIEGPLHRLRDFAHMELPTKTRAKEATCLTCVAFLMMRGSCAHRTDDENLFYWREGHWPAPITRLALSSRFFMFQKDTANYRVP